MEQDRYVTVIEGEDFRRNGPIEHFLSERVGSAF